MRSMQITDQTPFVVEWDGPHEFDDLPDTLASDDYKGYLEAFSIYALTASHPIYGDDVIVYIGKTTKQNVIKRLSQHKKSWWDGQAYLAIVYRFSDWQSYGNMTVDDAIFYTEGDSRNEDNQRIIGGIEELLIYALAPAYNIRNKKSAERGRNFRVFNTNDIQKLPHEISGLYHIERAPDPDKLKTI